MECCKCGNIFPNCFFLKAEEQHYRKNEYLCVFCVFEDIFDKKNRRKTERALIDAIQDLTIHSNAYEYLTCRDFIEKINMSKKKEK